MKFLTSDNKKLISDGKRLVTESPPSPPSLHIKYGYLYNQYAATSMITSSASWFVPNMTAFSTLETYLTTTYGDITSFNVGNYLKSCRQVSSPLGGECATSTHPRWDSNGTHYGLDAFKFSARPGGSRGTNGAFSGLIGQELVYWSTNTSGNNTRGMLSSGGVFAIMGGTIAPQAGYSIKIFRLATSQEQSGVIDGTYMENYIGNDGKWYQTVKIGTQVWIVQPLAETKLRNLTDLTLVTNGTTWSNATTGNLYYCLYNNDSQYL